MGRRCALRPTRTARSCAPLRSWTESHSKTPRSLPCPPHSQDARARSASATTTRSDAVACAGRDMSDHSVIECMDGANCVSDKDLVSHPTNPTCFITQPIPPAFEADSGYSALHALPTTSRGLDELSYHHDGANVPLGSEQAFHTGCCEAE
eukprot:619785-Rhodomonas_salina.1